MATKTPNIKERRTRILLTLFLLDKTRPHNIFEDTIKKVFSLPSDSPRTRGTLRQMLADEVIKKEEKLYRITNVGLSELALSFPFVRFMEMQWDGLYRILSYEVPENKRKLRDSLRREISGWGFGPWHRSFWVTPHPIVGDLKALIVNTPIEPFVQMFEGKTVVGDAKILLEKVWNTPKIEEGYKALFRQWHEVLSREGLSSSEKLSKIFSLYTDMLKIDPGLPAALVGEKWIGREAYDIFVEMRGILLAVK